MVKEQKIEVNEERCEYPEQGDNLMTEVPEDDTMMTGVSGGSEGLAEDTPESSGKVTEQDPIKRLTTELEQARSEVELYKDRWMRSVAEFENYKRRAGREFGEIIRGANEELLKQLLPILDNFERALNHVEQAEDAEGMTGAFRKGVDLIASQFRGVLERNGLQSIQALGEPFDPHLHEALMQRESDGHAPGTVIDVIEQGYRLNDRVLRHAKVVVSQ